MNQPGGGIVVRTFEASGLILNKENRMSISENSSEEKKAWDKWEDAAQILMFAAIEFAKTKNEYLAAKSKIVKKKTFWRVCSNKISGDNK